MAKLYNQKGWIANNNQGVIIELEGRPDQQQLFIAALKNQAPPFTDIQSLTIKQLPLCNFGSFDLKNSIPSSGHSTFVLPDLATCPECVADIFNPASRFYRYPFTSCCHCGPRYSIMQAQPYDRIQTSMADFQLCPACIDEYLTPDNRRFHAQTIACPLCGPQLSLLDNNGVLLCENNQALSEAVQVLREGKILAIKGIGGYQLMVDARNHHAVALLRQRKNRARKPFALMLPDLATAHQLCYINQNEQQSLTSTAAPIVLLKRRPVRAIAEAVAPDNALLGIMLPYSALHHLLLHDFSAPLVATSGNRQNEPLCINEQQVLERLGNIADVLLFHNRPILRPLDDSIVRLIGNKITVLRRARGYTPYPVTLKSSLPDSLAVGGHLKNTVAISHGKQLILSQHLGDLDTLTSQQQFQASIEDLQKFYQFQPKRVFHDLHPDYSSSKFARQMGIPAIAVQHHFAHILSCMAEHDLQAPLLGISWDGTGLGSDKQLWGGEFFLITEHGCKHFAQFRTFPLPGASKAIQEPRRSALGLLFELFCGNSDEYKHLLPCNVFSEHELALLNSTLEKKFNTPPTSSAGRLFDAVSSLLNLCQINTYEGEAAIQLETAASSCLSDKSYPFVIQQGLPLIVNWQQTIESILYDLHQGNHELIAIKFHNTLADMILKVAQLAHQGNIVLSGGCFQNTCLVEKTRQCLQANGFKVYQHEIIPPNDGGLALGQLLATQFHFSTNSIDQ